MESIATARLEKALDLQDNLWKEKSRVKWLHEGDRNTKIFHSYASMRRRKSAIRFLKSENGVIIDNMDELKEHVIDFYRNLRCSWGSSIHTHLLENIPKILGDETSAIFDIAYF
ncbi:hypothetical protein NE237_023040 [Protea cynaroides]|uniref:Uncharacterized protein n=1 Tax=Protea cynaroides TaxID=273540 RepID=A0A9Q0HD41_9MAGN|nr:hypothetical protein NE237_023040 [Protea cynaroides]